MEFNEVVTTRRSIRRYEARPVAQEDIEAMIQCAMEAPSWKNSQTARYHIITSSDMLNKMKTEGLAFQCRELEGCACFDYHDICQGSLRLR